jgi:hypothetical protein
MKNTEANKTELNPRSTLLFLVDFLKIEIVKRSANPDPLTASPMIKEPTISHTTSSESEWYNKSGSPAFIMTMNTISAIATNPAGILVVIHSVIADKNANKDIFAR